MDGKYFESEILNAVRKSEINKYLELSKSYSLSYIENINKRNVYPTSKAIRDLDIFDESLPQTPQTTEEIIELLNTYGSPATVAQTGGRYFGFVNGGILPASLSARWLSDTWDQNTALSIMSPIASKLEEVVEQWIIDLLQLPPTTGVGLLTGSSTATLCGVIAGRNHLLKNNGLDITKTGIQSSDDIKVVISEEAHASVFKALRMIGIGSDSVAKIPADSQGRLLVSNLPEIDNKTLIILQAGNLNTGAYEDFQSICTSANQKGAWVHVDGAFGLWAAASENLSHLTKGMELADSWSADAHKTLNAPYDNGMILCKRREDLINALQMTGPYIISASEKRDGMMYTPDMSRRARGVELWATLKSLGSQGVQELVDELHHKALYFADQLRARNFEIVNEVDSNQVLVYFNDDEKTDKLLREIQESGVCWMGGSRWSEKSVIRISVCSYKTTYQDIDISVNEIERLSKSIS
ncbi:pyridoxal phosphate-dependent decarboxylase family protein [Pseudalkalibacillus sp. JSM 102089]|uniref:pyridoxal phosphate-dependent decarboxylase family protein n=1 Tax=Pseudalkalibacillus sp. JSM 102089 TaxID=3229856 RepID=UPI003525DB12